MPSNSPQPRAPDGPIAPQSCLEVRRSSSGFGSAHAQRRQMSALRGRQGRSLRPQPAKLASPRLHPSTALPAGREASRGPSMGPRNQTRWLPHGRPPRQEPVQLLTRTGLDWTDRYPSAVAALANLNVKTAYLDGELCRIAEAGLPSFARTKAGPTDEPTARRLCDQRLRRVESARTVRIQGMRRYPLARLAAAPRCSGEPRAFGGAKRRQTGGMVCARRRSPLRLSTRGSRRGRRWSVVFNRPRRA